MVLYNVSEQVMTYSARVGGPFNLMQPVRFSVKLGAGEASRAPVNFCSENNINCRTYAPVYALDGARVTNNRANTLAVTYAKAFDQSAGKNPVTDASAASSAFFGLNPIIRPEQVGPCEFAALTVWSSHAWDGLTFEVAADFRTRVYDAEELDDMLAFDFQNLNINPLVDGGFSGDVTGIVSTMVSGATEILAFAQDSFKTFTPESAPDIANLFRGTPRTGNAVFRSPTFNEVIELRNSFPRIPGPKNARYLQAIAYGSIDCLTMRNDLFGVLPGQRIRLNVFALETTNITIGFPTEGFDSVFDYGVLVGEIVSALQASPQTSADILKNFFL